GGEGGAGVARPRRDHHLETGDVRVELLLRLRVVLEGANTAAVRHADHHRDVEAALRAHPVARAVVLDLVEALEREARELDLADGLEPVERHPDRGADDGRLRQRAVDHALRAELALQVVGHAEDAAVDADVFADDEHVAVALHLLEEGLVERLDHVQLGHGVSAGSAAGPASAWRPAGAWRARRKAPAPRARAPPARRAGRPGAAGARHTRDRTSSADREPAWPRNDEWLRRSLRPRAARGRPREDSPFPGRPCSRSAGASCP